jgi:alkylated DNA nucleotide flippase Atl1
MVRLTFEAETPAELDAQVRSYIDRSGGPPATPPTGGPSSTATNDDYRRAIRAIPRGKVASYGTVSEVVRGPGDTDGSQHVAGLAANDANLDTAYRVVKRDGSVAAGFRWSDGSKRGAVQGQRALEDEGVQFDARGRALPEYILTADELRKLYEDKQ